MKDEAPPVLEEAIAMQDQFIHSRDRESCRELRLWREVGVKERNPYVILLMSCKPFNFKLSLLL